MTDSKEINDESAFLVLDSIDFQPYAPHVPGPRLKWTIWRDESTSTIPDYMCDTLLEAVAWIINFANRGKGYCLKDTGEMFWRSK